MKTVPKKERIQTYRDFARLIESKKIASTCHGFYFFCRYNVAENIVMAIHEVAYLSDRDIQQAYPEVSLLMEESGVDPWEGIGRRDFGIETESSRYDKLKYNKFKATLFLLEAEALESSKK